MLWKCYAERPRLLNVTMVPWERNETLRTVMLMRWGNTFLLRILKPELLNAIALQWVMALKPVTIGGRGTPYNAVLCTIFLRIFRLKRIRPEQSWHSTNGTSRSLLREPRLHSVTWEVPLRSVSRHCLHLCWCIGEHIQSLCLLQWSFG